MKKGKSMIWVLCLCILMVMGLSGCQNAEKADKGQSVMQETETKGSAETGDSSEDESQNKSEKLRIAAEKGCLAPDIELNYLDGSTAKLSDYRGKVVLLNLWATWCGPCVNEMPAFHLLQEEFGDKLQLIALNCGDSADTVQSFAEKNGYTFPMALDEQYDIMLGTYQTSSIPYTVIIDPEGIISHISTGAGTADEMFNYYKEAIEEALSQ